MNSEYKNLRDVLEEYKDISPEDLSDEDIVKITNKSMELVMNGSSNRNNKIALFTKLKQMMENLNLTDFPLYKEIENSIKNVSKQAKQKNSTMS